MEHGQINLAGDDLADTHRRLASGTGNDFLRQGRGFCHGQSGLAAASHGLRVVARNDNGSAAMTMAVP